MEVKTKMVCQDSREVVGENGPRLLPVEAVDHLPDVLEHPRHVPYVRRQAQRLARGGHHHSVRQPEVAVKVPERVNLRAEETLATYFDN